MIVIDTTQLSPLERAAVEFMAATTPREMGLAAPTVEEYLRALFERAMSEWKDRFVAEQLPTLRPLATRYLSLDAEGQSRVLATLDELDQGRAADAGGAGETTSLT